MTMKSFFWTVVAFVVMAAGLWKLDFLNELTVTADQLIGAMVLVFSGFIFGIAFASSMKAGKKKENEIPILS